MLIPKAKGKKAQGKRVPRALASEWVACVCAVPLCGWCMPKEDKTQARARPNPTKRKRILRPRASKQRRSESKAYI